MTVAELMRILQRLPLDMEVAVWVQGKEAVNLRSDHIIDRDENFVAFGLEGYSYPREEGYTYP